MRAFPFVGSGLPRGYFSGKFLPVTSKPNDPPKSLYSGPLQAPVVFADPPLAAQVLGADHPDVAPAILEESNRVTQELLGKLPLLLDHFGVSRSAPDKWLQLS